MNTGVLILGGALLAVLGYSFIRVQDKHYRKRGVKIEQKAIAGLSLPPTWRVQPNLPVPGLGDADIFIMNPEGKSWTVEIKSYEGARKAPFSFFQRHEIVRPNGKAFERDPIKQALAVAEALSADPVLWLPKAKYHRPFKTRSGVIVVQGGPSRLEQAIGAKKSWF